MVDICVGSEFLVGASAELLLNRLGSGPTEEWSGSSDPAVSNGLKKSASGGLWVAPPAQVLRINDSVSHTPSVTLTGNQTHTPSLFTTDVINPSMDQSMLVMMVFQFKWHLGQEDNTISYALAGWDRDGSGSITPTSADSEKSSTQTTAGYLGTPLLYVEPVTDIIAAGLAATYRLQAAVQNLEGSCQYLTGSIKVQGIGITI